MQALEQLRNELQLLATCLSSDRHDGNPPTQNSQVASGSQLASRFEGTPVPQLEARGRRDVLRPRATTDSATPECSLSRPQNALLTCQVVCAADVTCARFSWQYFRTSVTHDSYQYHTPSTVVPY